MTLPTFAAERRRLQQISIDSWNTALAGRSAANQTYAAAAVDLRDRRTDGHFTVTYTLLCILHAMRTASIKGTLGVINLRRSK